ncbi:hypothetical protein J1614_009858 [Plenodomus biglobosus]|nr:hypothetical protein J1614_009858 [Plenodomus biglobosus]
MSSPHSNANNDAQPAGSRQSVALQISLSGRRSLPTMSASATLGPHFEDLSPRGRAASLTINSSLPRNPHTSADLNANDVIQQGRGVAARRSRLPGRGVRPALTISTTTFTTKPRVSPPSNSDGPGPSAAMAQVVSTYSPSKAEHTLVNAQSGGLSKSNWSIGNHEIVLELSKDDIYVNAETRCKQQSREHKQQQQNRRSASVGAVPKNTSNPILNRDFTQPTSSFEGEEERVLKDAEAVLRGPVDGGEIPSSLTPGRLPSRSRRESMGVSTPVKPIRSMRPARKCRPHRVDSYTPTASPAVSPIAAGYGPGAPQRVTPIRSREKAAQMAPLRVPSKIEKRLSSAEFVGFVSPPGVEADEPSGEKVKARRSFHNLFLKRDNRHAEHPQPNAQHKRSFLSETKSTFATRLSSMSLSKAYSRQSQTSQPDLKSILKRDSNSTTLFTTDTSSKNASRRATIDNSLETPADTSDDDSPTAYSKATKALRDMMSHINKIPEESDEHLRGLEIAQVLLKSLKCYNKAIMSADNARRHTRAAEFNADQAMVGLRRLLQLCEDKLDSETQAALREYIKSAT